MTKKKKVVRKTEQTEKPKLSLKSLDERLERVTALLEKLTAGPEQIEPEPDPPIPKYVPPPLVEGNTYIFCSGPAKEQKLRITPGYATNPNVITGEYQLVPPEIIDFGEMDEGSGPKGFHVISNASKEDLEEVKKIRKALEMVKTREIIEVTGDPAFEYIAQ